MRDDATLMASGDGTRPLTRAPGGLSLGERLISAPLPLLGKQPSSPLLGERSRVRAGEGIFALLLTLLLSAGSFAAEPADVGGLLERAESIKTSNHAEFTEIVESLEKRAQSLTPAQRDYLRYLRGWQHAYVGNYQRAIAALKSLTDSAADKTVQFRARATLVNVLSLAKRYEEAFSELNRLLDQLDRVSDKAARDQGLAVAALLHSEVGQRDLSLMYSEKMIEENWNGLGMCRGGQLKVRALYDSTRTGARPPELDQEISKGIDACITSGELTYANVIRGYQSRLHMERNELQQALELLTQHYDEVAKSQYPRLISQYDVLLAQLHWRMENANQARRFALRAAQGAVKTEYTEPLAAAYHLLYSIERQRGNEGTALDYHEKYTAADKGYLDELSARQLAYERVKHEVAANKLAIESLQLQQKLDAKAIENVRLYVALLIVSLAFIGFWAYKTKRSQLHFMKLSRHDGLTGIFNRPHFMELAVSTLENCRKLKQDASIVLSDIDHFKQINDRFGHPEGDAVLKRMVAACQMHLRTGDVFARVGGEEFCILLPACGLQDARERAEEVRKAIANLSAKGEASITASLGLAGTESSGYDLQQLLAHADVALYQAKRAGRDCVVVYDSDSVVSAIRTGAVSASP